MQYFYLHESLDGRSSPFIGVWGNTLRQLVLEISNTSFNPNLFSHMISISLTCLNSLLDHQQWYYAKFQTMFLLIFYSSSLNVFSPSVTLYKYFFKTIILWWQKAIYFCKNTSNTIGYYNNFSKRKLQLECF